MRLISSGRHHATFEFGDLQVVSLRDGYIDMPPTRLRDEDGCAFDALPAAVPLAGDNLRLSVNAFYVTDGTWSVLIDTGASNAWHDPTMGLIYDALDEAGINPAHITDVAITHKHEDHVSGLIAPDGSEAFTKLERVWIGAGDTSVFTGRLEPMRERVVPVTEKTPINEWLTAIPTPGHTPGHTVYDVSSGPAHLLVWGDTVHVPTLQFDRPNVTWEFDGNQPQARAARATLLEQLTQPHHYVAGAHLDSPGIARVTPAGDGYALEYLAPPIG
ncbi:glyoxylase-like metal-dependent hydrolase (beta-lactamase superfamily II) [Kitasatospora gansuensis]|uniref:Glyoxylase-like metal-dependent hydrolase (Beta-lactamase superfamily II) n=1 Tax=Kitasatospora gansuensis TaxID=258050 RepID=A0A7W7S607_9ACTN|nr:MBL fold metallo-hydrolase [Kitasatospora gansuensis]MBB4944499.1 glyoxylase-like metal-dependent hydrolase (beta-lactamase superfamily II) [Kitasatospora gansuensis]